MDWTAPDVTRTEWSFTGDERTTLEGFLDWYRATLLYKCAGLSASQLAEEAVPPSNMSLLGMLRHMTDVERSWFRIRFGGEPVERMYDTPDSPEGDWEGISPASAQADYATFLAELDLARAAAAGHSLEETFVHPRVDEPISLRWVYVHMIEEYARHCGHADLMRERIDGAVGQ
jgi:uncharacterized damage-inducible protein DinB